MGAHAGSPSSTTPSFTDFRNTSSVFHAGRVALPRDRASFAARVAPTNRYGRAGARPSPGAYGRAGARPSRVAFSGMMGGRLPRHFSNPSASSFAADRSTAVGLSGRTTTGPHAERSWSCTAAPTAEIVATKNMRHVCFIILTYVLSHIKTTTCVPIRGGQRHQSIHHPLPPGQGGRRR